MSYGSPAESADVGVCLFFQAEDGIRDYKVTGVQTCALPILQDGRAVVYQVDGPALRNVTARYRGMAEALWKPETPRFINLGDTAFAEYAGAGWDECAGGYRGYRMLRGEATVHI